MLVPINTFDTNFFPIYTVMSYQIESFFIKMRAAFLVLSFRHNSREDGGNKGSSHFDEKLSIW